MRLQDLSRDWARRCLDIPRFCLETLGIDLHRARLVLAYSAGVDSTALLHILSCLRAPLKLTLTAAHVHHGLRPDSDHEQSHAVKTCAALDIPCATTRLTIPAHGPGIEARARLQRYAFLEEVRLRYDAAWIVTAHHGEDLAEDILLRLVRGTGWPGLGGMQGVDHTRRLLRPVLNWAKRDLQTFLSEHGITWCEDRSNLSDRHTRNRFRHTILPLLQRENPQLTQTLLHLWRLARVDEDYWERVLPPVLPGQDEYVLDAASIPPHPAQRLRVFKKILDAMGPGQALASHLFLLDKAWTDHSIGCTVQFPGDKIGCIAVSGIRFSRQQRRPLPATNI